MGISKRKKLNTQSPQEIDLYSIGESTSKFGRKAEKYLNISINETDDFEDIINHDIAENNIVFDEEDVDQELRDLYLDDFNIDEIRKYKPQEYPHFPKNIRSFLSKLKLVVNNNYADVQPPRVEGYIHDLMNFLLTEANFDDGLHLTLRTCVLDLQISDETFAANADKEGRRGAEIIWVLDEDKCRFDNRWRKGDIQLIANMIAASQKNRALMDKVHPERMIGIKFDADCLYFYSSYVTESYLDCLTESEPPNIPLVVNKFPKSKPLSLSNNQDRKTLFLYLAALRKYALSLTPYYMS